MEKGLLTLKILLPNKVFAELKEVQRMTAETAQGSFGILPKRLDCVAALVPGILSYETETGKKNYLAINEGILVKTDTEVLVSVRNAIAGTSLGKLRESVESEFKNLDEAEKNVRSVMVKLESGFIRTLEKFRSK
jgi:F-type H+-transporting ATPase subunit epsilon